MTKTKKQNPITVDPKVTITQDEKGKMIIDYPGFNMNELVGILEISKNLVIQNILEQTKERKVNITI